MKNQSIPPQLLQRLLSKGITLIDVREPIEHEETHIEGAILIPLGQLEGRSSELSKKQPLVVMCRGGKRGAEAMRTLEKLGFSDIANLEGGLLAWQDSGLPVKIGVRKGFPLMQQVQITIGSCVLLGVILSRTLHPDWVFLSAFFGAGLVFAGTTGWCGLATLMSKMPWNRLPSKSCCTSGNCHS